MIENPALSGVIEGGTNDRADVRERDRQLVVTCSTCPTASVRTLAGVRYCDGCAEFIVGPLRAKVNRADGAEGFAGIGRPGTPADGYPHGWWNLICDLCGAGWTGLEGHNCGWCIKRYEESATEQRDILLRPDLPEPGDKFHRSAIDAWIERLGRGVLAGIVTEADARRAVERFEVRHAA